MVNGFVPSLEMSLVENERTGFHFNLPLIKPTTPGYIRRMRMDSFTYIASRLFNILPKQLREQVKDNDRKQSSAVENYKKKLDEYLTTLQDEPTIQGLTRAASSNSIIDQVKFIQT